MFKPIGIPKLTKVLITGASGLLGANLVRYYAKEADCTGLYGTRPISITGANLEQVDLTDHASVARTLKRLQPELIVHCAAATNVEWCEKNPERAKAINEDATLFLVEQASEMGAKFVFTSTDSVFDGINGNYSEADKPRPLNTYAEGKVRTEISIGRLDKNALIIRSYFYGYSPSATRSLLEWVLLRAKAGELVPGFTDSYFSPISVHDFAYALNSAIRAGTSGLLHLGSRDSISQYEFARMVMEAYNCDMSLLRPTTVDDAGLNADRPRNTSLNVGMLERIWGQLIPSIADGIRRMAKSTNPFG